jgi:ElaB/YqjD/DUF883 family membrane-anchored ribosome-binding protein
VGVSDDLRRLLESENFSVGHVKRIAHDDMKRRWAVREEQERLQKVQEKSMFEVIRKVTLEYISRTAGGMGAAGSAVEVSAVNAKVGLMQEAIKDLRLEVRRVLNQLDTIGAEQSSRTDNEIRKTVAEFNSYRSQVAVRFNETKESIVSLQTEMRFRLESERSRLTGVSERIIAFENEILNASKKVSDLIGEQETLKSVCAAQSLKLHDTDIKILHVLEKLQLASIESQRTIENNSRMERILLENAEFYDEELNTLRKQMSDSVKKVKVLHDERLDFVQVTEKKLLGMATELNDYVEKLPNSDEIFRLCLEYESWWVSLHTHGLEINETSAAVPDLLHRHIADLAFRIAYYVDKAANRLVLTSWTAGSTGRKPVSNPQSAPKFHVSVSKSNSKVDTPPSSRNVLLTENIGGDLMVNGDLSLGRKLVSTWNMPSDSSLINSVREELLQKYLSDGYVECLKQADSSGGVPGYLRGAGRAMFHRKLLAAVHMALQKHHYLSNASVNEAEELRHLMASTAQAKPQHSNKPFGCGFLPGKDGNVTELFADANKISSSQDASKLMASENEQQERCISPPSISIRLNAVNENRKDAVVAEARKSGIFREKIRPVSAGATLRHRKVLIENQSSPDLHSNNNQDLRVQTLATEKQFNSTDRTQEERFMFKQDASVHSSDVRKFDASQLAFDPISRKIVGSFEKNVTKYRPGVGKFGVLRQRALNCIVRNS